MPEGFPNALTTGIYVDIKDGSFLSEGQVGTLDSSAVRRGFIKGAGKFNVNLFDSLQDHKQLQRAVLKALISTHIMNGAGEPIHPFANVEIPLVRVKVWRWGPHAYFELVYKFTKYTNLSQPAATTVSYRRTYEHAVAYRVTSVNGVPVNSWQDGLPFGDIDFPNASAGPSDPNNIPRATVKKKAALQMVVHSVVSGEHPLTHAGSIPFSAANHMNTINANDFTHVGNESGFPLPFSIIAGRGRYDGAVVNWVGVDRWAVDYYFTIAAGGHFTQVARYDGSWNVFNEYTAPRVTWAAGDFPVAY